MKDKLLLIFVKHPVAGKAKTRLAASLGNDAALEIYQKLLNHTLSVSLEVDVDKTVWYGNEIPENDLWSEAGYKRYPQANGGLGERMKAAFEWGFGKGYKKIAIIGSDNARLTPAHIKDAFDALETNEVSIGPALDGGYYLLGLKHPLADLFEGKEWSTDSVFQDTIKDLDRLGITPHLLETLADVDVEEDLKGTFLEAYLPARE